VSPQFLALDEKSKAFGDARRSEGTVLRPSPAVFAVKRAVFAADVVC